MATVIDALVVTLGLDPKGVQKGGKEVTTAFGKVTQGVTKMGKDVSASVDSAADSFRSLQRNALAFFAVLTAGKTLKAFIADTTSSNVAAGNLARNLGTSVNSLTTWQKAAQAMGGTAEDVSSSMGSLVSQFQTIEGRRNLGLVFGQLGVRLNDANGQLRSMNELVPDLAASAQRLGPQLFSALGGQAGFSQGFINLLEQGPDKVRSLYQSLQRYAPTDRDTKTSAQLYEDWTKLTAQSEAFGRSIMTDLGPEVHNLFLFISQLVDANQEWIRQDISKYASQLGEAIKKIDWSNVNKDIYQFKEYITSIDFQRILNDVSQFATTADAAAKAVGGWAAASKILFDLWLGSKIVGLVSGMSGVASLLSVLAGGGVAAGGGAVIAGGAVSIAATAAGAAWVSALTEIAKDNTYGGQLENRRNIASRHDPYYSGNRYGNLEQNQIRHMLYGYGVNTLHRDPRDVSAMLAEIQAESGFNTQAIGDKGSAIGFLQWHLDRQQWIERQAGKSITRMTPQEQLEWAFRERDEKYKSIPKSPLSGDTAASIARKLTSDFIIPKDIAGQSSIRASLADHIFANEQQPNPAVNAYNKGMLDAVRSNSPATRSGGNMINNNTINIHAPGGDPKAVTHAVKQAMGDLGFMARQSSIGLA